MSPECEVLTGEIDRLREGLALVEQQLRDAAMMGKRKALLAIADRLRVLQG